MAKIYTDKEIKDAANAGVFISNPKTTTSTPASTTKYSSPIGPTQDTKNLYSPVAAAQSKSKKSTLTQDDVKAQITDALNAYKTQVANQKAVDTQKYITDQTGLLNSLTEAQKASRTKLLNDAYNKTIGSLDIQANTAKTNTANTISTLRQKLNELTGYDSQFQTNRNQASAKSAQLGQALAERLAASGNAFGGQAVRDNIANNTTLQNNLNQQNLSEANVKTDYANQENVLNSNLATLLDNIAANKQQATEGLGNNIAAAIAEIEAAKNQEMMNLQKQGMDYSVQNNQIASNNNNQAYNNALAAIQAIGNIDTQTLNNAINKAQVTGYYNPNENSGTPTVNYDPANIQATINQLKAINPNDPNIAALENIRYNKIMSDPTLKAQYGDQYKTTQQKQIEAQQKISELEYAIKDAQQKALIDPNSTENKIKAEQLKQLQAQTKQIEAVDPTLANQENQLKLEQIRAQIAQINASTANIGANNDLERQYKQGQISLQNKQLENYDSLIGSRDGKGDSTFDIQLTSILNSKPDDETRLQYIKDNMEEIISTKGKSYYDKLFNQYN